jgi:hypothetical protein
MISISSKGICGEDDFGCARLKEGRLSAGNAGSHQVEKSRYGLDMEGFWLCDKFRIIADINTFLSIGSEPGYAPPRKIGGLSLALWCRPPASTLAKAEGEARRWLWGNEKPG